MYQIAYQITAAHIFHHHQHWLLNGTISNQCDHIWMPRNALHYGNFGKEFIHFLNIVIFYKSKMPFEIGHNWFEFKLKRIYCHLIWVIWESTHTFQFLYSNQTGTFFRADTIRNCQINTAKCPFSNIMTQFQWCRWYFTVLKLFAIKKIFLEFYWTEPVRK